MNVFEYAASGTQTNKFSLKSSVLKDWYIKCNSHPLKSWCAAKHSCHKFNMQLVKAINNIFPQLLKCGWTLNFTFLQFAQCCMMLFPVLRYTYKQQRTFDLMINYISIVHDKKQIHCHNLLDDCEAFIYTSTCSIGVVQCRSIFIF